MRKLLDNKTVRAVLLGVMLLVICLSLLSIMGSVLKMRRLAAAPPPTPAPTAQPTPEPTPAPTPEPTPTPTPTPEPTPPPYEPPAELAESRAVNPDVIAWLDIPGTATSYPILCEPDVDNYYLDITIDGDEGYPGSIYTNSMEGRDFATFNTVIYGHNMRDGSYFGSLRNYRDPGYLAEHREIDIYTDSQKHAYRIFAVVDYDNRYITDWYHDAYEGERAAFLQSLLDFGAEFAEDVEVDTDSHIITLSTCVGDETRRLLIVAAEQPPQTGESGTE